MADEEKKKQPKNELEAFLEAHKEQFERFRRIAEETEEEMEEIARRKAEHPEMTDTEHQIAVTNAFLAENPDLPHATLSPKDDKE